ncbi:MAG: DUF4340 domain-containing protein [Phycisphaerae bacterium]
MNFKTTLSLLIILVVILGVSWYLGVFSSMPAKLSASPVPVVEAGKFFLITPKLQDLTRVRLELSGKGYLVFDKKGEKWEIAEPIVAPALGWELTDLVSAFEQACKLDTIIPASMKDFGLDDPIYKITFEEKGRKIIYLVGKNVVASENTYVKTPDGKEVFVVDQNLRAKVKKDLADYRDKQLWELKKEKINEMEFVSREGTVFKFTKGENEKWQMLSPVKAPAGQDAITNAVNAISTIKAQEFADDKPTNLATYGLDKPVWKITVAQTQPTTQPAIKRTEHVILIGASSGLKADQVFAKLADKNWVVTIASDDIKKLSPDAASWRDKKILDLDRNVISEIQIQKGGLKTVLTKTDQAWKLRSGKELVPADTQTVDNVLNTLIGLEATSFVDHVDSKFIQKSKLDYPVARVKIVAAKSASIDLTIGDTTPSGLFRYVKRSGLDYVTAVSNEKIAPLLQPALSYNSKRLLEFNMDNVKSIEVTYAKKTYTVERPSQNAPWKVSAPIAADADPENVKNLLLTLTTAAAQEFVGKNNLERYSLAKPLLLVKVATETAESVRHEYALALAKADNRIYAARPDVPNPLVGVVSGKLFSDLTAELIDRTIFANLPTQQIDRIELKRFGSEPMVFEKTAGVWKFPSDPVFTADKDKLEQIISALGQLKAMRYVEFQPKKDFGLQRPHFKISVSAGKDVYSLTVGQVVEKQNRYAQTANRPWVFVLSADDYAKLDKTLKDLAK